MYGKERNQNNKIRVLEKWSEMAIIVVVVIIITIIMFRSQLVENKGKIDRLNYAAVRYYITRVFWLQKTFLHGNDMDSTLILIIIIFRMNDVLLVLLLLLYGIILDDQTCVVCILFAHLTLLPPDEPDDDDAVVVFDAFKSSLKFDFMAVGMALLR